MIVLIHEIGHWVTHQLPHKYVSTWPTEFYTKTTRKVHEGWAQIISWWIVDEIGGGLKNTFEKLNQKQSSPYQVYNDLVNEDINTVIKTLEILRILNKGATLDDWFTYFKI
jgi:hypothetical protein